MEKLRMETKNLSQENIKKLQELFPEIVTEKEIVTENGKLEIKKTVDFDALKEVLGDFVEGRKEKYQLTWPGKQASRQKVGLPINKTLRPVRSESVNWDTTKNLYIEGDNFEVLKLLQESYLNKVKMIYIDPPYNTGNDFVYNDNFTADSEEYAEDSGMVNEQGQKLFKPVANADSNGRFHSDWLSMMYERLKVARDLLTEDGVIFISIDDNEQANLKKICDEIFGESNFIADLIWKSKSGGANDVNNIATDSEFIICYAKNINLINFNLDKDAEVTTTYNQQDEKGKYGLDRLDKQSLGYQPSLDFPIIGPDGNIYTVEHKNLESKVARWRWGKETVKERYNELVFKYPYVYTKNYEKEGIIPRNLLIDERFGRSRTGKTEVKDLFEGKIFFDFPKPTKLINFLNKIASNNQDMILDFFSGSATTAHAVMQLNAEDGGNRQFIMVQLSESTSEDSEAFKAGYKSIPEIGRERIKRAAAKIKAETNANIDYGFRTYKLDETNMKDVFYNPTKLKQFMISGLESNIKEDRTSEDLLAQVMLELGLTLDLPMEEKQIENKTVHFVAGNSLVACFENNLSRQLIEEIAKEQPLRVVFKDGAFTSDSERINLEETFKNLSPNTTVKVL
ncbi:MAG: site-specific DNA-methyltransferase [Spirochaetales bacterium]